jgi:hypothetical protein
MITKRPPKEVIMFMVLEGQEGLARLSAGSKLRL